MIKDFRFYDGWQCRMVRVLFYHLGTWWIEDMTVDRFDEIRGWGGR